MENYTWFNLIPSVSYHTLSCYCVSPFCEIDWLLRKVTIYGKYTYNECKDHCVLNHVGFVILEDPRLKGIWIDL